MSIRQKTIRPVLHPVLGLLSLLLLSLVPATAIRAQQTRSGQRHSQPAHSQWDIVVGPRLGLTLSNITHQGGSWRPGVSTGGFMEVYMLEKTTFNFSADYTLQGSSGARPADGVRADYTLGYIGTDYVFRHYYTPEWSALIGFRASFLVHADRHVSGHGHKILDGLSERDLSFPVGVAYDRGRYVLEGRFYIPVKKISAGPEDPVVAPSAKNVMLTLTAAMKFRAL